MDNIGKFIEPTYQNHHSIISTPSFDGGYGMGEASGHMGYGCAQSRYTYYDGSGITTTTIAAGIGFGIGESNNLKSINCEEYI